MKGEFVRHQSHCSRCVCHWQWAGVLGASCRHNKWMRNNSVNVCPCAKTYGAFSDSLYQTLRVGFNSSKFSPQKIFDILSKLLVRPPSVSSGARYIHHLGLLHEALYFTPLTIKKACTKPIQTRCLIFVHLKINMVNLSAISFTSPHQHGVFSSTHRLAGKVTMFCC